MKSFIFILTIILGVLNLATSFVLAFSLEQSETRVIALEKTSDYWKEQTGKAYTELLKSQSSSKSSILIPAGATLNCEHSLENNQIVLKCAEGQVYPSSTL